MQSVCRGPPPGTSSLRQLASQPSPARRLPSSHSSPASSTPFPQVGAGGVGETDGVVVRVADGVADAVRIAVTLAVAVADGVAVGVSVAVADALGVGVALAVALGVTDGVAVAVSLGVGVVVTS